jgi:hypothetical protein
MPLRRADHRGIEYAALSIIFLPRITTVARQQLGQPAAIRTTFLKDEDGTKSTPDPVIILCSHKEEKEACPARQ